MKNISYLSRWTTNGLFSRRHFDFSGNIGLYFFTIISYDKRTMDCWVVEPVIFSQRVATNELFTRRHFDFFVEYLAIVHLYSHEATTMEQYAPLTSLISTGGWQKNCSPGDKLSFLLLSSVRAARLVHNTRLCVHGLIRCYAMLNTWKVGLPSRVCILFN